MINGFITTKYVISHPVKLSKTFGVWKYFYFVIKALSHKTFQFTSLLFRQRD